MYVVPAKTVREVLNFRITSLNACGMEAIAHLIQRDLVAIVQDEITTNVSEAKEQQAERLHTIRERNFRHPWS